VVGGPAREGDPAHGILVADAGAYYCGVIHGDARFCLELAGGCSYQNHQNNTLVNLNAVYLTAGNPRGSGKTDGYTGGCDREVMFDNRWDELEDLVLAPRAFRRFGDTIGAMYDAGGGAVGTNCSTVVVPASRLMHFGTP
jgi:hypothetical protein